MKVQHRQEKIAKLYPLPLPVSFTRLNERKKIALPTMEGLCFEKVEDIVYLSADNNYTHIYFRGSRRILVCRTLKEVESMLCQQAQFVRIHRSHTINLNFLQKYIKGKSGKVVLNNGQVLNISAGQKSNFILAIEQYFNF